MSHDSTPASEGAKIPFKEAIKSLSRENLEKLADDQSATIALVWDITTTILSKDNPSSLKEIMQLSSDMLEILEDNEVLHEVFYGGEHREHLLNLFPALRGEGGAA